MKCCCLSVHPSVCRIAQQRLSDRHAVRTEWRAVESRVGVDDARTCSSYSSCTVRAWWPVIAATNASSVTGELTARWMRLAGWLESHLKPREIRTTSGLTSLHHNYCSSSSSKRWILTVCDALQWVTCQWHYHRLMCVVCSWLTSLQYNTHTHTPPSSFIRLSADEPSAHWLNAVLIAHLFMRHVLFPHSFIPVLNFWLVTENNACTKMGDRLTNRNKLQKNMIGVKCQQL